MSQDHLGLFDTPPDRRQIRFCLAIVGLMFAPLFLIVPARGTRLVEVDAFIPMIDAVMFVGELITATLLYAQASVFRSRALTVLATGYLYTALLIIPHALTFPGAFVPAGLLGAGMGTTAWLGILRRAAFPIAVVLYAALKRPGAAAAPEPERRAPGTVVQVLAAVVLAAATTLLTTRGHDLLPPFFSSRSEVIHSYFVVYESVVFALSVVAAIVLFLRRTSVLDMWLLVAVSCWVIQSLADMTLSGRFTAGWYWLNLLMLFSHLVVMLALLAESNRLYARLALATSARNRERDARLMSIDAVAAAISHEVGQPLAAVNTNAMVGLRWLTRPRPDVDMAIKSLRATIDAGQLATDVIKSIRAMFAKGPRRTTEFDLNDLVRGTASLLDRELASENVSLQLALHEGLPPIRADRVQMTQVLLNLLTNAIESLGETRGRPRRIAIRSAPMDGHDVLLEVSDNGAGIAPEEMEEIFEAFFTTKTTGAGLGLSLCRTIVEVHGGRLWASQAEEGGATFHMQLPRSSGPHPIQA